ncbi:LytTR family DNA-binding domain-containing protein [Brevundimonas faecalis]|uniref:Two-component system LytT family response regulator n=1 Tax=Brevundimonas faecalis TaxID=947378 RepID=A0ABV2R8Y2_9CAUL
MNRETVVRAEPAPPLSWRRVATGAAVVFGAYALVLTAARGEGVAATLLGAAANTVPVVLMGLVARRLILRFLIGRRTALLAAGHLAVGLGFALAAYWMLLVLLGLIHGVSATEFDVRPFDHRAMAWQTLQNLTTYGVIAALVHLEAARAALTAAAVGTTEEVAKPVASGGDLSRYFIRSGEDIRPIEVAAIISIAGADDYAEVKTAAGRHLVRMTLTEFEAALDPDRFARVHRSHIVNLDRIARAEPAGNGRLLLHMEDGERIQTSRAGSQRVRARVL